MLLPAKASRFQPVFGVFSGAFGVWLGVQNPAVQKRKKRPAITVPGGRLRRKLLENSAENVDFYIVMCCHNISHLPRHTKEGVKMRPYLSVSQWAVSTDALPPPDKRVKTEQYKDCRKRRLS